MKQLLPKITVSGRVGRKHHVDLTLDNGHLHAQWAPERPAKLTRRDLRDYRQLREQLIKQLEDEHGVRALVVDLGDRR